MILLLFACGTPETAEAPPAGPPLDPAVVDALSMERIRADVDRIADDAQGGRVPGSPGHRFVGDWLVREMEDAGLEPIGGSLSIEVPLTLGQRGWGLDEAGQVYEVPLEQTGRNLLGLRGA